MWLKNDAGPRLRRWEVNACSLFAFFVWSNFIGDYSVTKSWELIED